jgi:signal transduction histidine kinase
MDPRPSALPALLAPAVARTDGLAPLREAGQWLVRRWVPLLLLWSVPGIISATQNYWLVQMKEPAYTFTTALLGQLPPWQYWSLVTPAILWLGRRRRLDGEGRAASIGLHLLFNLLVSCGHIAAVFHAGRLVKHAWFLEHGLLESLPLMLGKHVQLELLTYWGILAVGYALDYHRRHREMELARAQLETQLTQAQLDALKMQLHPHFLFNTLNAISVLVRKQDTPGALRMLNGVGELLRASLHNAGRQFIPLQQELAFLDRYLDIEQTRFQDRLQVHRAIDPGVLDAEVPNLLLQPLVENAIKHGLATRAAAGRVELRASRQGERLHIEIRDDGPGLKPGWDEATSGCIGVANVRDRLRRLYGEAHHFTLENHPEGGVRAVLELPFRRATEERPT